VNQFATATEKHIFNVPILPEETWMKLKNIFDTLDTFGNEKICVQAFFHKIKNNASSIGLLSTPAVEFPEINRIYSLEKVIFDLENKMEFEAKTDWETIKDIITHFTHIEEPTFDLICS